MQMLVVLLMLIGAAEGFTILAQRDPASSVPPESQKGGLHLFRHRVCLQAMGALLGVGKGRVSRLRKAVAQGDDCPVDGRLQQMQHKVRFDQFHHKKRELIVDFLTHLYVKHSEPMPEVQTDPRMQTNQKLRFRRARGKRPKRQKKRHDKLDEKASKELRMLPPGSYSDYLKLFHAHHPDTKVSFKLFTRVLWGSCLTTFFKYVFQDI